MSSTLDYKDNTPLPLPLRIHLIYRVSISQCPVLDKNQLFQHKEKLLNELESMRGREGFDLSIVMITNVIESYSTLLFCGEPKILLEEAFKQDTSQGLITLPGVMSRKKQVVPPLSEAAKILGA